MNYASVVQRLFGRVPTNLSLVSVVEAGTPEAVAIEEARGHLADFSDAPRAVARVGDRFAAVGRTHAVLMNSASTDIARIPEEEQEKDPPASVRELTPVEKKNAREHIKHGRKAYRFGRFKPGMAVTWNGERWIVYDARARGGSRFTLMLVSPDYDKLADEVQPSELGETESADVDQTDDPFAGDAWTQASRDIAKLHAEKPRPINKMFGANPTDEQKAKHAELMREWSKKDREARKRLKAAKAAANETVDESKSFTPAQLAQLRDQFASVERVDPTGAAYDKMIKLLDGMSQHQLKQVAGAGIKFLSKLALNRVKQAEAVGEARVRRVLWSTKVGNDTWGAAVLGPHFFATLNGEDYDFEDGEVYGLVAPKKVPTAIAARLEKFRLDFEADKQTARESVQEARFQHGDRVRIHYKNPRTDIEKAFQGKVGSISGEERDGSTRMFRVKFSPPVQVPGVDPVTSDLWTAEFLKPAGAAETAFQRLWLGEFGQLSESVDEASDLDAEIDRVSRDLEYARADYRSENDPAKKRKLKARMAKLDASFEALLAKRKAGAGEGGDGDGKWRTTQSGHKIFIDGSGKVTKGNPHVIGKAKESVDESKLPKMQRGQIWTLSYTGPAEDPDLWLFVTGLQKDGTPEGVQYDVMRQRATMQSFRGYTGTFAQQDVASFLDMTADQKPKVGDYPSTPARRVTDTLARFGVLKLFPGISESEVVEGRGAPSWRTLADELIELSNEIDAEAEVSLEVWRGNWNLQLGPGKPTKDRRAAWASATIDPGLTMDDAKEVALDMLDQIKGDRQHDESVAERVSGANLAGWRVVTSSTGATVRSKDSRTFHVVVDKDGELRATDGAGNEVPVSGLPGYVIRAVEKMLGAAVSEARKAKHAYGVGDRVEVHGEGPGEIVRLRHDSPNAYEVRFAKGGTKVVWDNPEGAAAVGFRKIKRAESVDEAQLPKSPHKGKPWDDVVAMGKGSYVVKIWRGQKTKWHYSLDNPQGGGFGTSVEVQDVMSVIRKALDIAPNLKPKRAWVVVGARKPTDPFDPFEVASAFWFDTEKNLPESVDEAKAVPAIDSPTYRDVAKLPKYNAKVSPLSAHGSDGGKLLAKRLPGWTRADHTAAAIHHEEKAQEMQADHSRLLDVAARETWGRDFEPTDYKISGIGSDEFSAKHKDELRRLAHTSSAHKDAAHAHRAAAKMRSLAKEDLDESTYYLIRRDDGKFLDGMEWVDEDPGFGFRDMATARKAASDAVIRGKLRKGKFQIVPRDTDDVDESLVDEAQVGSTMSLFLKLEKTVLKKTEGMPGTAPVYSQLVKMLGHVRDAIKGHETKTGDDAVRAFVPAAATAGFMANFGAPMTQLQKHPLVNHDKFTGKLSIVESVDEMAKLSAKGAKELMRASKESVVPDDESIDWRRVTRAWMDDGRVLEKRDVNFKATGTADYQKARKHSYGWKVLGRFKPGLLKDNEKLAAAMAKTRANLEAEGWAIESFTMPQ